MGVSTTQTAAGIVVEVSADRLSAHLAVPDAARFAVLTEEEVREALAQARIAIDDATNERVRQFLELIAAGGAPPERFLIAEGRPAVEAQDAEFVWAERFQQEAQDWQSDAPINYYKLSNITLVQSGEVIGTLRPAVPGQEGVDVHGNPIPPRRVPQEIELDDSVGRAEDDPNVLIAKVPGRVELARRRLTVIETVDIRGDVDFESGSINSPVDVRIGGTVQSDFEVKSAGSITVGGAIEAALVEAAGDIAVRGGIVGYHRGRVRAGGEIVAKFCNEADLQADGNISIHKEALGSRIHSKGRFICGHGSVIGGRVYAREGAEVGVLGSEAGVPTLLVVGPDPDVLAEAERIERNVAAQEKSAAKIREIVEPLLANRKRLTPAQKERATELLYQADSMEESITSLTQRRERMLAETQPTDEPAVLISKTVHAGAAIQIGRRRTVFQGDLRGPLRIERRKVNNVTEFVAVNELSGALTVLPSAEIEAEEDDEPPADESNGG